MKPLVIIPARGGSKGVPRKNLKLLNGMPLIHYTIKAAKELFPDEVICVSTDDVDIKKCAEALINVPFLRPKELATDETGTFEVLIHTLNEYKALGMDIDTVIILQPTSPFRNSKHIREAINLYDNTIDMVVSVKETKSNPYFVLFEEDSNGLLRKCKEGTFVRRQDCPKVWEYNGAIYIINVESLVGVNNVSFQRIKKYEMDDHSSHDIDDAIDWSIAEILVKEFNLG